MRRRASSEDDKALTLIAAVALLPVQFECEIAGPIRDDIEAVMLVMDFVEYVPIFQIPPHDEFPLTANTFSYVIYAGFTYNQWQVMRGQLEEMKTASTIT